MFAGSNFSIFVAFFFSRSAKTFPLKEKYRNIFVRKNFLHWSKALIWKKASQESGNASRVTAVIIGQLPEQWNSNCYRVKKINVFYISDYRFTNISSISIACSLMKERKSCTTTWKRIPQNCKIKSPERKSSCKTKFPQIIEKKTLMLNKFENFSVKSVRE